MNLHSVSMVRDEEDVIEAFVRHSLEFVDRVHVVVHQSVDATLDILRLLEAEGLPIGVSVSEDPVFRQGATLTSLARSAFAAGADRVFVLDADEFLAAPGRSTVEATLARLGRDQIGAIPWKTYIPLPEDPPGEAHVLRRIVHRPLQERKMLGKVILGPGFAADPAQFLLEGSHWAYRRTAEGHEALAMQVFTGVQIAHFPVRSPAQAVAKLLQRRWQRRIAWVDEPISRLVASGWRSTFDRMTDAVLERGTLTAEELAWFAYDYSGAYDPGPLPPIAAFRQDLVRDPCGARPAELRYASHITTPLKGFFRWLDRVVAPPGPSH